MNLDLFDHPDFHSNWREDLCPGAVVLRGAALEDDVKVLAEIDRIAGLVPFQYRDAGRLCDVGGDDQLRGFWLGDRQSRLPLSGNVTGKSAAVAADARAVSRHCGEGGKRGRFP